jgi:hypothetical protein
MRLVRIKSAEQQGQLMQHRTRDLLMRQRTQSINALRAHLAELGIVAAQGDKGVKELLAIVSAGHFIASASCGRSELNSLHEGIEAVLLLQTVLPWRPGRFLFEGQVHTLVAAVLLRGLAAWLGELSGA